MAVGYSVGGTGFYAIAAEDAAGIVNVVDLGVAFAGGDAIGRGILSRFDVNAVRGTRGGAEEAANALLVAILITLKDMDAPVAGLDAGWDVREALRGGLAKHGTQRDAEAFVERNERFADFLEDGCH